MSIVWLRVQARLPHRTRAAYIPVEAGGSVRHSTATRFGLSATDRNHRGSEGL